MSNSSFSKLLAGKLRRFPQILPVEPEQVEGVVQQTVLAASCEFSLQFGEVGTAFVDDHNLSVNDGLVWKVEGAGNDGETLNPVVAVAGEGLAGVAVEVKLDAVAVVFDLVNPVLARRELSS